MAMLRPKHTKGLADEMTAAKKDADANASGALATSGADEQSEE